jgi:hypothetical protein
MFHAGRAAGVHPLLKELIAIPLTAFEDVNFFPEIVHERFDASATGLNLQHACDEHPLGVFGEDFLVMPRRRSLNGNPWNAIGGEEFQFRLWHLDLLISMIDFGGYRRP